MCINTNKTIPFISFRRNKASFQWQHVGHVQHPWYPLKGGASGVDGELATQEIGSGSQFKSYSGARLHHSIPTSQSPIHLQLSPGAPASFSPSPLPLHAHQQPEHAPLPSPIRAPLKSSPEPNPYPTSIPGQPVAMPLQHYQLAPHHVERLYFLLRPRRSSSISPGSERGSQHALQPSLGPQAVLTRRGVSSRATAAPKEILHRFAERPGRSQPFFASSVSRRHSYVVFATPPHHQTTS